MDTGPQNKYFSLLAEGRFQIQGCESCGACVFYPRVVCPYCGSDRLYWFKPEGRATVYSTTVVRRDREKGGDYNVALVDLVEGPRMMTSIRGIEPDQVKIGMEVEFHSIDTETHDAVYFQPTGNA
jgi:hypothetical protein